VATAGFLPADLDGDGRTDLVTVDQRVSATGVASPTAVALVSTGGSFALREWPLPAAAADVPARAWRPADLNGDGRADLVAAVPDAAGYERVVGLLFTGSGWVWQVQQIPQLVAAPTAAVQIADFDGDGCVDLAWVSGASLQNPRVNWLLNQYEGDFEWTDLTPSGSRDTWALSWHAADTDGDGQDELLSFRRAGADSVSIDRYAANESAGRVTRVENGIGLSVGIRYGTTAGTFSATLYGRNRPVVTSMASQAMTGGPGTSSRYTYSGALWSSRTRGFLGFKTVSVTTASSGSAIADQQVVATYEQTDGCALRPSRTEVRDAAGRLFWADTNTYRDSSAAPVANAPWICELERSGRTECELTQTCRETSVQVRDYDQYGNVVKLNGLGDPADPHDDRLTTTQMAQPNISRYLVNLPFEVEMTDASGRLALSRTYYDGATSSGAMPTAGDATRTEDWDPQLGTLTTDRGFDGAGNLTSVTDADGRTTTTDWDPTLARFPIHDCNALWCTSKDWDLVAGTVHTTTDQNNHVTQSVYDPLGRHRRTDFPDGGCLVHSYPDWGPPGNPIYFTQQRVVEQP
jgi:hypothetical protein